MTRKRLQLTITGVVQGVAFRAYTVEEATRLGLTGWVCNRADGSVEVCGEGPEEALNMLATWCEQGPPHAQVAAVDRRWSAATGEYRRFAITRC
jgi:acylphosphatase